MGQDVSDVPPICVNKKLRLALNAAKMHAYERNLQTGIVTKTFAPSTIGLQNAEQNFISSSDILTTMHHDDSIKMIYHEDRERIERQVNQAIADRAEFELEFRIEIAPGELRWFVAHGRPSLDENGVPTHIYAVSQDVTEKKALEESHRRQAEELAETQDQLARALDAAGMAAFESFGKVSAIRSPAFKRLLGFKPGAPDITPQIFIECVHPEDREMMRIKIRSSEPVVHDEFRVVLPESGEVRWLLAKGSSALGSPDSIRSYIVMQDITERKNAQEELRKKSEQLAAVNSKLERFSAVVAHDLKGPLSTITMSAGLAESAPTLKEAKEYLSFMKRGAMRMVNLVDDLLAYAKLGTNQKIPREPVPLKEVVETVCANLQSALVKQATILEIADEEPWVHGHVGHLTQVFQNLIANALKFVSDKTPEIRISFRELADCWVVQIKDNGVGMEEEALKNLFQPFKRFHGSRFEGTGLGLSIVRNIVERHDGKIWAESKPGVGSSFYFTLPKAPEMEVGQSSYLGSQR